MKMKEKIIFLVFVIMLFVGCSQQIDFEKKCSEINGKWIGDAKECEEITKEQCEILNGEYEECASACRNDPEAQFCTMQCVQVCKF